MNYFHMNIKKTSLTWVEIQGSCAAWPHAPTQNSESIVRIRAWNYNTCRLILGDSRRTSEKKYVEWLRMARIFNNSPFWKENIGTVVSIPKRTDYRSICGWQQRGADDREQLAWLPTKRFLVLKRAAKLAIITVR